MRGMVRTMSRAKMAAKVEREFQKRVKPRRHKFTESELLDKIRETWPGLGAQLSREFAFVLMRSDLYPPGAASLDDICFASDEFSPAHCLLLLARYCYDLDLVEAAADMETDG